VRGRRLLTLYRGSSAGVRLHTALRWASCPFPAVEAAVPPQGRILEVGCGHGLLSLFLALSGPARRVHGVDVDESKVDAARVAAGRLGPEEAQVSFDTVARGWLPDEEVDAVVIADVLYLLAPDEQRRLLAACAGCLGPGGVLIVKEVATEPSWKFRWNQAQETVSTRVLGITAGGEGLHFVPPATMAGWLVDEGLSVASRPVDRGYPWPHHLLVARRPTSAP
jgi:2-polyprenyl-3-methyl-5-hydroxy-6-metoxy-1,4-benzoquinol methylase